MWWLGVNWCSWCVYDESVKINDHRASMTSRWWIGDESVMSRWWIGDESVMNWWWVGDDLVKINDKSLKIGDASMMSWWLVGDKSVKIDLSWCVNDKSVMSCWTSMIMMRRWWVDDESVMSSVMSWWKSMMSRWLVGENRWCVDESLFIQKFTDFWIPRKNFSLNLLS